MKLTWKDAVASTIVGIAIALYAAHLFGADLAFVSGPRVLAAVLLGLGFAAFVAAAEIPDQPEEPAGGRWLTVFGVLGTISAIAGVAGMISASPVFLAVLVGSITLMWILATVRHAYSGAGRHITVT
jgi:hypothetical protein